MDGPNVTLMPPSGQYALTVNLAPPATYRIYIDLGWDLRWVERDGRSSRPASTWTWTSSAPSTAAASGSTTATSGTSTASSYGYPLEIVEKLESLAVDLEERVRAGVAPFDDATPDAWLDRLVALATSAEPGVDA